MFALAFVVPGWVASHREPDVHGYMGALELAGGVGLGLAFGLTLRALSEKEEPLEQDPG